MHACLCHEFPLLAGLESAGVTHGVVAHVPDLESYSVAAPIRHWCPQGLAIHDALKDCSYQTVGPIERHRACGCQTSLAQLASMMIRMEIV